jgi:hypothetical protein
MDLNLLKKELPFKWRVQSFSKSKPSATCVAYIDARDAMDLLDEVVGVGNWQKSFYEVKGNLFCSVSIKINGEWVSQSDCGTESSTEKIKGEASDAFKRACVGWGIGRFLYAKDIVYVKASEKKTQSNYPYCIDENGKQIYDLSKYINNLQATQKAQTIYKKAENKPVEQPKKEIDNKTILATPTPAKEVSKVTAIRQFNAEKCNETLLTYKYVDQVRKLKNEVKKYYGEEVLKNSEVIAMFRTYESLPEAPVSEVMEG